MNLPKTRLYGDGPILHWMNLARFFPPLILFTLIFAAIELLYVARASAMRSLAVRLGLRYTRGDPRKWYLPKAYKPSPASFRLRGYPVDTLNRMWNVIEGEHGGVKVLIVDATLSMGGKRGRYSTFVATKTDENLFRLRTEPEKIAQSNGWTALYRLRFWQTPWTLSIRRIEEHLASLRG